jgi:DNA-binding NarL/FixJ family response regulator
MGTVRDDVTEFTVALVGGRRFREKCLAQYLEMSGACIAIGSVENLWETLSSQVGAIDLVIIDAGEHICSDRSITGILAGLRNVLPSVPVVVISDREDWPAVLDALSHAVRAYFPSSLDPEILLETLRFVKRGGTFIPIEVLTNTRMGRNRSPGSEAKRRGPRGLRPSEQRVLELLREGKPNKVIGRELGIEETTVKVHVRRIMKKLNAANRTQAALVAQQMAGANASEAAMIGSARSRWDP